MVNKRSPALLIAALFLGVVGIVSCRETTSPIEFETQLQLAADSIDCIGAHGSQRCLNARELIGRDARGDWRPFFNSIEGFTHTPGFTYDLLVRKRVVPDPPADESSHVYRLIKILRQSGSAG